MRGMYDTHVPWVIHALTCTGAGPKGPLRSKPTAPPALDAAAAAAAAPPPAALPILTPAPAPRLSGGNSSSQDPGTKEDPARDIVPTAVPAAGAMRFL